VTSTGPSAPTRASSTSATALSRFQIQGSKIEVGGIAAQNLAHGDGNLPPTGLPEAGAGEVAEYAAARNHDRQPLDERMAQGSEAAPSERGVPGVLEEPGADGAARPLATGERPPGAPRDSGDVRAESETADVGILGHDLADRGRRQRWRPVTMQDSPSTPGRG
jgi:hypothetical protein